MKQEEKFSDLINQLTEMWLLWMKNNNETKNILLSYKERSVAVDECERLINLEYKITGKLDKFFVK